MNWDCGGEERITTFGPSPLGPTYIYQGCHTDEDQFEWALDGRASVFLFPPPPIPIRPKDRNKSRTLADKLF